MTKQLIRPTIFYSSSARIDNDLGFYSTFGVHNCKHKFYVGEICAAFLNINDATASNAEHKPNILT